MKHLDLFSGIGGFALACRMVGGIETVAFCEREPFAQKVLRKHWPDVPICDDIHELKGNEYGPIDLVTGGFPCQPYSLAGERRGNEDDRALWPQMLRVIREARPAWVLGENVAGIITLALDGVLADLEGEGYACEAIVVPACAVDAKHRRDRVWIVGHSTQLERNDCSSARSGEHQWQWQKPVGGSSRTLADTNGAGLGERCWAISIRQEYASAKHRCAWQPEADWFSQSGMGRVAHGIPSRVDRLKGLGNAIVPQVAAEIIRGMTRISQAVSELRAA